MIIVYKIVVFSGFRTRAHGIPTQVRYQLYHIAVIARFRVSSLFNYRLYANSTIEQNKIKHKDTSITHFLSLILTIIMIIISHIHSYIHVFIVPFYILRSSSHNLLVQKRYHYKTVGERSFSFYGPQLWNSLPSHLRSIENFTTFKRELKTYFFEMYYTDS